MTTARELYEAVRDAWASIPAPPAEDLKYMAWGWGEDAADAFTNVAPVDVDIEPEGFYAATPLLDLPPRAGAAYLGTFVMSLLKGLEFQQAVGLFDDILSRAHTITVLENRRFWERAIHPFLPAKAREVLAKVVTYLASESKALALTPEQAEKMVALATADEPASKRP